MVNEKRIRNRRMALLQLLLLLGILVAVNWLGSVYYARVDLTAEKRFSMAEPTRDLLRNLEDIVAITVYLDGNLPPNLARLQEETLRLLRQWEREAGGNLVFRIQDPNAISDRDNRLAFYKQLQERSLFPVEFRASASAGEGLSQSYVFPYAELEYQGGEPEAIVLLDYPQPVLTPQYDPEAAVAMLEYNFARAIVRATRRIKPRIAFVEGQGELDTLEVLDLEYALREFYRVDRFDLNAINQIDTGYQALILAGSSRNFSMVNKYKLDQYVMRGGSILWCLDGVQAEFDSLRRRGEFFTQPFARQMEDLLFQYGARINENLIQDRQCARIAVPMGNSGQFENRPWPYDPILTNVNPGHPITRNLDAIEGRFVSSVDTVIVPGVRKTVLLSSSANARFLPDPVRVRFNLLVTPLSDEQYNRANLPVAVLLEGSFPSAFRSIRSLATQFSSRGVGGAEFLLSGVPSRQIVIGDADMVRNAVAPDGRIAPLGLNNIEQYIFANKDFALNCVEYLTDEGGLMESRAKVIRLRPLDPLKVSESRTYWPFFSVIAPLFILMLFGGIYNVLRYRRYGQIPPTNLP
ncbi:MAG: gliding motility-associated ABC transporter substrate-binding protein GldG [Bacteroidetes bacterium]|nr:gliding motility-associated ABC transporter substrate-binding protein GldG [Bacteroidota bacterium]